MNLKRIKKLFKIAKETVRLEKAFNKAKELNDHKAMAAIMIAAVDLDEILKTV